MGWETSPSGRRYYTRSTRQNGRVARHYFGNGELAEAASELDAFHRESQRLQAAADRAEMAEYDELERHVESLCELADLWAQLALLAAGYHQHNRGEWRKRRVQGSTDQESNTDERQPRDHPHPDQSGERG